MRIELLVTSISAAANCITDRVAETNAETNITGETLTSLSLPSFTNQEKAQLEKAISNELNYKELKAAADVAYDAELYYSSRNFFRRRKTTPHRKNISKERRKL
jgi:hypothetical protein